VQIDSVEKRSGDAAHVSLNGHRRAFADAAGVAEEAAGTGIHGGDEHEAGGERRRCQRPGDGDDAAFERLS
jgi:hypothetical protein